MHYDYTREALYHPERKPAFKGLRPGMAFDPAQPGFSVMNGWWLSNLSHLAYYDEEPLRAALDKVGLELVDFYDEQGTQGFLAKSTEYGVLAFRGTEADEFRDILQDVKFPPVSFDDKGMVHGGFREAIEHVWERVDSGLQLLKSAGIPVWYTGHSLGAALATLAAARRAPAALFTFGSPRVGDADFEDTVANLSAHRFINGADIVTTVPPADFGFRHIGDLYFFSEATPLTKNPTNRRVRAVRAKEIWKYALRLPLLRGWVAARSFVDHAIVNYSAGLWRELG